MPVFCTIYSIMELFLLVQYVQIVHTYTRTLLKASAL